MGYDISHLWAWLALAIVLGGAVGWFTEGPEPQGPWLYGWVRGAIYLLAFAIVLVGIHAFSGRVAFWLESAVLFALAYLFGGVAGGALRRSGLGLA